MPKAVVPELTRVASKWVRRAAGAAQDYAEGVERTTKSQSGNAIAARQLYVSQITLPATHDRWERNLRRAGDEAFKRGVKEKGSQRYAPGVAASEGKYSERVSPVLAAIAAVDLPARGLPASPQNYQRTQLIGQALNKLKLAAPR